MMSVEAMFGVWVAFTFQSGLLLLIGIASITTTRIGIFEVKPHSDLHLIRWQVFSCLAALISSICAYISFVRNPDPLLCNVAVRFGMCTYSIAKLFLYLFFEVRLSSVRQSRPRTIGEKAILGGTASVLVVALAYLFFGEGKVELDADGLSSYCKQTVEYLFPAIMAMQDIILSPAYLVKFVHPLIELNREIKSAEMDHSMSVGTSYNSVIMRNALASGVSAVTTAAFLVGYASMIIIHQGEVGHPLENLFNMMRALDLYFNCLSMFICTISLWTIRETRSLHSSDDSGKKVVADSHVKKGLFPHELTGKSAIEHSKAKPTTSLDNAYSIQPKPAAGCGP